MDPIIFIGIVVAIIIATTLKSITGFGTALLLMPLFSVVFNMRDAIAIMALVDLASNALILYRDSKHTTLSELKELSIGLLLGTTAGVMLLKFINVDSLKVLLGVFIFAYIVFQQFDLKFKMEKPKTKSILGYVFGFIGGIFGGLFSTNGPAVFVYIKSAFKKKKVLRANLVLIFFLDSVWRTGLLVASGQFSVKALLIFLLVTLPTLLFGIYIGGKIDKKIRSKHYSILSKGILFFSGIKLLVG